MIAPTSFFGDYGCHVRILEETRALEALGHSVTICTYAKGRDVDGVHIERTAPLPWRSSYEVGTSRHRIAFDALLFPKVLAVARRVKPHIVHGHLHEGAFIGYPISRLWRVPLVFDFQGSMTGEMVDHHFLNPDGPWYRPARWLEEVINRLPHAIIASSHHAVGLCIREFGCPPERLHAIPDCVNADVFRPDVTTPAERQALKGQLGIPADRQVVVYLGLLAEYQGTGLLLQAAAHVLAERRDVHFLIMGYPGVPTYQARAQELGVADHVTFTGRIPYEEAPRYLSLGDVAVAPKISATEGSGKILNYMAMALPTAAFATPVSREYLRDEGAYAPVGNAEALGDAMLKLLAEPERAAALGRILRERAVREYSWAEAARRLVEIYDELSKHQNHGLATASR